MSELSTIWGNTDGCADQYRCASALYLMLVLSQRHPVKIYWCISAPEHGNDVIDGINAIDKRYIYQLMSNVQLPVSITFDLQIIIYSYTNKNDVSLDEEWSLLKPWYSVSVTVVSNNYYNFLVWSKYILPWQMIHSQK